MQVRVKNRFNSYFVFVELVQRFSLDLLESVVSVCGQMQGLIDFGVFLSRAEEVNLLKILFPEHFEIN